MIGVMCGTVGITLLLAFVMARENRKRDAEHGQLSGVGHGIEDEKSAGVFAGEEEEEVLGQKNLSDGTNKEFRYTL